MATETAKVKTLADVKAASAVSKEETSPPVEATNEATPPKAEVDYEAELAKYREKAEREARLREYERERRKRAEAAVKYPVRVAGEEEPTGAETDLDALLDERFLALKQEQATDLVQDVLSSLSDNPKERELIQAIYENDIRQTGYSRKAVEDDLKKSFLLANRGRFEEVAFKRAKAHEEKAQAEKQAVTSSATRGAVGRTPPEGATSYNAEEAKWLGYVGKTKVEGD